jgi:hypothetical protein
MKLLKSLLVVFPFLVACGLSSGNIQSKQSTDLEARRIRRIAVFAPTWHIISDSEVREAGSAVAPGDDRMRVRRIGETVYADAVITGRVLRYRERVGGDIGVQSPASVAFILDLVDVQRGDVVWSARFDETQKAISENILSLGDIRERGIRWLTAEQLAQDGVRKVVQQLHETIAHGPASK